MTQQPVEIVVARVFVPAVGEQHDAVDAICVEGGPDLIDAGAGSPCTAACRSVAAPGSVAELIELRSHRADRDQLLIVGAPGCMSVVKTQRPTSSSGANSSSESIAASLANSSLLAPEPATGSPMEPETSITTSTCARFRRSDQTAGCDRAPLVKEARGPGRAVSAGARSLVW